MTRALAGQLCSRARGAWGQAAGILGFMVCAALECGCATVSQSHRDTLVRTRTETEPTSDWSFTGHGALVLDGAGAVTGVRAALSKDRACRVTVVRTIDRTLVTERTMQNELRSRRMAYTMGSLGAAGAVTNIVAATQTDDKATQEVLGALAGIGAYLSISLIVMIAREIDAIDSETHVGLVDLREAKNTTCDQGPAGGARVRLLRSKDVVVAEATSGRDGVVLLPVDSASLSGDMVHALEVDGAIVSHIEIPAARPAPVAPAAVAAPPAGEAER